MTPRHLVGASGETELPLMEIRMAAAGAALGGDRELIEGVVKGQVPVSHTCFTPLISSATQAKTLFYSVYHHSHYAVPFA